MANALGRAIAFYLGPAIVARQSDMPILLLMEAGLALIPVLAVFIYYPNEPLLVPSGAAAREKRTRADFHSTHRTVMASFGQTLKEFGAACQRPNLLVIALAGGLQMGVYGAWSGVLPNVLSSRFSAKMVRSCLALAAVNAD